MIHDAPHWTDITPGSGLTNFSPEDFPLYEEAVRRHGNKDFIVSSTRMLGRGRDGPGGSLHYLGKFRCEEGNQALSEFWRTFYEVKREFTETVSAREEIK